MDQARVLSGYDLEVALEGRYMQYLLLLASDVGLFPTEVTFGTDPVQVRVQQSPLMDRTYELLPAAPQPDLTNRDDAFRVAVLHDHPGGADLRINLRLHVIKASANIDLGGVSVGLLVKLRLDTTRETDGPGLESIALATELVDLDGDLIVIAEGLGYPKATMLAQLKPHLDRVIALDGLGSGKRLQDVALRKLEADPDTGAPAVLVIYVNLVLRAGPQPDNFRAARGDVASGVNFLDPDSDITFATRPGLLRDFGDDAFYRRAKLSGSGYDYPLKQGKERVGRYVGIDAGPVTNGTATVNQLLITIEGEYEINHIPNPNFKVHVQLSQSTDPDGIMSWSTGLDVEAGLLAHIVMGLVSLALVPLMGPWALLVFVGLEIAGYIAAEIVEEVYEERADDRVDATLLDVTPNRLTIVGRRWDPFFETNHQIGLRPGGTLVTHQGFAIWGRAALTTAAAASPGVVIREAVRDSDGRAMSLRYLVDDIDPFRSDLTTAAPAARRWGFSQDDPEGEPYLFTLPVEATAEDPGALGRARSDELRASHPYLVKAIETDANQVEHLLVISEQESDAERARLLGAHAEVAAAQVTPEHQAEIREAVLAEFAASGVIPTPEQVDAAVAARVRALIDEEMTRYEEDQLPADLESAIAPLLRLELPPTEFGRLQDGDLLRLRDFELLELRSSQRWYYRDRYIAADEPTVAAREADNLRSKPRYRTTAAGREWLPPS